jgi:hypothetical protein
MIRGRLSRILLLPVATLASGCLILGPDALSMDAIVERGTVTADEPALVRVTARNDGYDRVQWGHGSSTCQLYLGVRVDTTWYAVVGHGICTMDYRAHYLDPGHSRTEVIGWDGRIWRDDAFERVPPGSYEVRGAAGLVAASPPVTITVAPD